MLLFSKSNAFVLAMAAGLVLTPIASGQSGRPSPGQSGPRAPFVPAAQSKPRAFFPQTPATLPPRPKIRVVGMPVPDMGQRGLGMSRPLPLDFGGVKAKGAKPLPINFGGTKAKAPRMIGSAPAPVITNDPSKNLSPIPPFRGSGGVTFIRDGDRRSRGGRGGGSLGTGPTLPPSDPTFGDSGFTGVIGSSGVDLSFSTGGRGGRGFSFTTDINNSSNVAVLNTGIWLTPGLHSIGRQWGCYGPYWGGGYYGYNDYNDGYPIYSPTWPYPDPYLSAYYTTSSTGVQAEPQPPGATPPTMLEQAEALLGVKRFDDAALAYREHLAAYPDDAEAMRMLAVVLVLDRKPREAAEYMLSAYRMSPALANNPVVLPPGLTDEDLAKAANRAIEHAQRTRTAPAWLSAAVLSQARDKLPVAHNFAKSAKAAGLDPEVFARLMSAWNS